MNRGVHRRSQVANVVKPTFVMSVFLVYLLTLGVVGAVGFDKKIENTIFYIQLVLGIGGALLFASYWMVWRFGTKGKTRNVRKGYVIPGIVVSWAFVYGVLAIARHYVKDEDVAKDLNIVMTVVSFGLFIIGLLAFIVFIERNKSGSSAVRRSRTPAFTMYEEL